MQSTLMHIWLKITAKEVCGSVLFKWRTLLFLLRDGYFFLNIIISAEFLFRIYTYELRYYGYMWHYGSLKGKTGKQIDSKQNYTPRKGMFPGVSTTSVKFCWEIEEIKEEYFLGCFRDWDKILQFPYSLIKAHWSP